MAEKRKDGRGRNLRTGEYYDSKNKRYMFRKMIDGERVTITAVDLVELRTQEHELLCKLQLILQHIYQEYYRKKTDWKNYKGRLPENH